HPRSPIHGPLTAMPHARRALADLEWFDTAWPARARITAIAPPADAPVALIDGVPPPGHPGTVWERAEGFEYLVDAGGFWQAHHRAPETLRAAVQNAVGHVQGATVLDLFSGTGLCTVPLAAAAGASGRVHAAEGDRRA